jgi:hypothetical protein
MPRMTGLTVNTLPVALEGTVEMSDTATTDDSTPSPVYLKVREIVNVREHETDE